MDLPRKGTEMSKVYLFVEIDVQPNKRADFLTEISRHGAHIRTENGCEALEIFTDTKNPDRVCVWEIWSNRELWDANMVNEASKAWQVIARDFVNGEKITVMDSIN